MYTFLHRSKIALLATLLLTGFASCQSYNQTDKTDIAAAKQPETPAVDSVRLAARRPAPEFYILTPDIYKNRVYVCDDIYSDVFHVKYDCEVLAKCDATKRNVTLVTAIRDFGRYNCEVCSPELAHVFDEEKVR
ncbi:hypothetical protein [Botryobacter ruber]|uniref:hypothetical protein n=1 Tax=Botryobacter ruber TaxID=2171629 RepID=UPI000F648AED|nr:hypothetical protein [Botryobacter ruber]